jgi:acyl-CoA synthetase (AMP-forming)/AMP-acid ligase II
VPSANHPGSPGRRLLRTHFPVSTCAAVTVVDRVRARAEHFGERVALVEAERTTTFATLYDRVDRLSSALGALGLKKGDVFIAVLGNQREAIECELAALQSGVAWVTLNARLTADEIRGVMATCPPKLVVTDAVGLERARDGVRTLPRSPALRIAVTGEHPMGTGTLDAPLSYESLLAAGTPRRPDRRVAAEDVARLRYTSGTTGSAKAAVLPHRVYDASLDNLLAELPDLGPEDRTLHVAPLTHGSGALVYPMLWAGGQNVLMTHFDIEETLATIEKRRITTMFTVPTILARLIAAPSFEARDLSSLRSLIYGGAPMPEAQLVRAVEKIGHALLHIYGMTEAPWPITTLRQDEHRIGNPHLRCIGRPTTVCELRIVDDEGNVLGEDQIGEIQIRGR